AARAGGDQRQALEPVARRADHCGGRSPRLRSVPLLRPGGAGRHTAPDRRQAQQGAPRRAHKRGGAQAPGHRPGPARPEPAGRRRGRAEPELAGRMRRPDRPRGNEVVEGGQGFRRQGGVMSLRAHALALVTVVSATFAVPVSAQDYPTRPITLVVPYAAGGGNDVMARTVADTMSRELGQQIVVENRAGAGGTIATRQVAKSAPDGYTLVIGGTGTLAVNPTLYSNVGYDP